MAFKFEYGLSETLTSGSTVACGTFNSYTFGVEYAKKEIAKVSVKSVTLVDLLTGEVLYANEKEN